MFPQGNSRVEQSLSESGTSCDSNYGQIQNANIIEFTEETIFHDAIPVDMMNLHKIPNDKGKRKKQNQKPWIYYQTKIIAE